MTCEDAIHYKSVETFLNFMKTNLCTKPILSLKEINLKIANNEEGLMHNSRAQKSL